MNIQRIYLGFIIATAVMVTGFSVKAMEQAFERQVTGEISWVDLKDGKLQIEHDAVKGKTEVSEYRVTAHETRVTDPEDKQQMTVEDLWPGQQVKIDVVNGKEGDIVQKVTVTRSKRSDLQEAYGEIRSIEESGSLVLAGRPVLGETGRADTSSFVFDPKEIVVMQSPSSKPVELTLKPGDIVKVEFVMRNKKQQARSITLYSPRVPSTTTTTTVTTTQ